MGVSDVYEAGQKLAAKTLPESYFKNQAEVRVPKAPARAIFPYFFLETVIAAIAFVVLYVTFNDKYTITTTTENKLVPLPAKCVTLNPKKGVVYYSTEHSENAQFASPFMTSQECVAFLEANKVCGDGNRHDVISVWGVTNPNNTQYYSSGHLSFTPTQKQGKTTSLASFYTSSVSFPRPDITRTAFAGTSTNWYVYEFAKNTDNDAFASFPNVHVSSFYTDVETSIVYDRTSSAQVFDLSSSISINASNSNKISNLGTATGNYNITDIGVVDGVYYGLQTSISFSQPFGIAVDAKNNVYVSDALLNNVRKIDPITGAVIVLGVNANPPLKSPSGIAVDSSSNVYVADAGNKQLRRIDASTDAVIDVGAAANPPITFTAPNAVAVDSQGIVYVTDNQASLYKIAVDKTRSILGTGTLLKPNFVCVDASGNVYVTDIGGGASVKKIDAATGAITDLLSASTDFIAYGIAFDNASGNVYVSDIKQGTIYMFNPTTSASSSWTLFYYPYGVAVDSNGQVYVADNGNALVRVINAAIVKRFGFLQPPRVFSWDMKQNANNPSIITLWPNTALLNNNPLSTGNKNITLIDTSSGACVKVKSNDGSCYLLSHAEYNAETKLIYLQFNRRINTWGRDTGFSYISILDPSSAHTAIPSIFTASSTPFAVTPNLLAVFQTPLNGPVLFTDQGAISSTPDVLGKAKALTSYTNYVGLIAAVGTSIIDIIKIPNSPPRYLLLHLDQKGFASTFTYDTFTDTIISSNDKAAATTHLMLAYTWGICDGNVTRSLLEITFNNDYSNICKQPSSGMYYQSPNYYYPIPLDCLGIAYDKLLTDCPSIKATMHKLVNDTCAASIPKVCKAQYDDNPPFSCSIEVAPDPLSSISLAYSTTSAIYAAAAVFFAFLLKYQYSNYVPSRKEKHVLSPNEELGTLVKQLMMAIFCCQSTKQGDGKGKRGEEEAEEDDDDGDGIGDGDIDGDGDIEMKWSTRKMRVLVEQAEEQEDKRGGEGDDDATFFLIVGESVLLTGFTSSNKHQELNGQQGTVLAYLPESRSFRIQLVPTQLLLAYATFGSFGGEDRLVVVKVENVRPTTPALAVMLAMQRETSRLQKEVISLRKEVRKIKMR